MMRDPITEILLNQELGFESSRYQKLAFPLPETGVWKLFEYSCIVAIMHWLAIMHKPLSYIIIPGGLAAYVWEQKNIAPCKW